MSVSVLLLSDIDIDPLRQLLARYQLKLEIVQEETIPGSFWGDEEAGLIGDTVYTRMNTPIHSILHETCHFICMDTQRRQKLHTNAAGDYAEENAVCYLQILLADQIPEMGQNRMMRDMDRWGYSFRLGSSSNWFTQDAEDARQWLLEHHLIKQQHPTFSLRQ
ncbi:MAG: hypothetical protein QNJ56_04480 [Gammaproteobacteria bacterium]|nr:hypothetical protein [Gammaproteobacteria bacterium]